MDEQRKVALMNALAALAPYATEEQLEHAVAALTSSAPTIAAIVAPPNEAAAPPKPPKPVRLKTKNNNGTKVLKRTKNYPEGIAIPDLLASLLQDGTFTQGRFNIDDLRQILRRDAISYIKLDNDRIMWKGHAKAKARKATTTAPAAPAPAPEPEPVD